MIELDGPIAFLVILILGLAALLYVAAWATQTDCGYGYRAAKYEPVWCRK